MKIFKKTSIFVLIGLLMIGLMACGPKDPVVTTGGGDTGGVGLTPDKDLTILDDLIDYATAEKFYQPTPVTYGNTTKEVQDLEARISEKKTDVDNGDDVSSVVKIFANSDATEIIAKMSAAALPNDKMTKLVAYLAGESSTTITAEMITAKVASGVLADTTGWSFFDDWDYYEKLKDEADDITGKSEQDQDRDSDYVKKQYRNMAKKIFVIGMSGDEFGRVVVEEVSYAKDDVLSEMAGAIFETSNNDYWDYCKNNLKDYDLLVYLLGFNDLLISTQGKAKSVQLYGYYYDYEENNYNQTSDDEFNLQLKYSHQDIFTDAEWLENVELQRNNYENCYRYSDSFYEDHFYLSHLTFQGLKEERENQVYGIEVYKNTKYTKQMLDGMRNGGFAGQLKMSDWMWCYGGDDTKMNVYNQAATMYNENKDTENAEKAAEGSFKYNEQQLKLTEYLLTNMSHIELGCTLKYQIYNYSSDMISRIQKNKKESKLLINNISLINTDNDNEYAYILDDNYATTNEGAIDYAVGKLGAINNQIDIALTTVDVSSKIQSASGESWDTIRDEITDALEPTQYESIEKYIDKKERQEDLVIKRKWSNGDAIDGVDTSGDGHAICTKEYDTTHAISRFADKYASILQHASGQSVLEFRELRNKDYNLTLKTEDETYYCPLYYDKANGNTGKVLTPTELLIGTDYDEWQSKTINSGKGFVDGLESYDNETKEWYNNEAKKLDKNSYDAEEKKVGHSGADNYRYDYVFVGWYIDTDLLYKLEDTDKIYTDMIIYPGYKAMKTAR